MGPHSPWTREDRWALIVLLLACAIGFFALVHPWHTFMNDGSIYLSTTRSLLRGEGYAYLGQPFHLRPVGFPLLLAPVMALADADPAVLNRYVALFGVASLVLLYTYVRPWLGGVLALCATAVVATNPIFLKLSSEVMSDVPGLCFLLLALLAARRADVERSLGWEIVLGLSIAWAAHVRVLAVFLLPAVLLDRAMRWRRSEAPVPFGEFVRTRCLVVVATVVIGFAPWVARNAITANPPPADQLLNYSYATAMFHYDFGDPSSPRVTAGDWLKRVGERGQQMTAGLASRLVRTEVEPLDLVLASLLGGALVYTLFTSGGTGAFFVAFALAITGSYFAYQDRLLLPVFALLVPLLLRASRQQLARFVEPRVATALCVALCVGVIAADFEPRRAWESLVARHDRKLANRDLLLENFPADHRFATVRGFHYHMLLDRPVYSLRWSHRIAPGRDGLDALLSRYRIETIVLDPAERLDAEALPAYEAAFGSARSLGELRLIDRTAP